MTERNAGGTRGPLWRALGVVLRLAMAVMILVAFAWPYAIDADPSSPVLRVTCLAAFGVYLAAIVARLALRVRAGRRR